MLSSSATSRVVMRGALLQLKIIVLTLEAMSIAQHNSQMACGARRVARLKIPSSLTTH
ncbi:hypothetical protein KIN20_027023 [Parelaphostrongylus tenuis]|uniref:Uncharacterized protein n=1 Tax=Parelaphostrongylus tenuis TaxID=148309 RepID=A0AAD5WDM9_PARTN|nr:hypothetical protein KIN20_027023 [Parelaphostrongylus tenuis]